MSNHQPIQLLEVELTEPLPAIAAVSATTGQHYQRAQALVKLHTRPLGIVELDLTEHGLSADAYAREIWRTLNDEITEHLRQDHLPLTELTAAGLPPVEQPDCLRERESVLRQAPFASVVVATRDRTEQLGVCLQSLLAQHYPHFEIIVVDSAPRDEATADFIKQTYQAEPKVRYIRAAQPGLAVAHNYALPKIQGEIVAITDDDVRVDSYWLAEFVSAFHAAPNVGCVTGMILPAELETPAQVLIERFGLTKGFKPRMFDLTKHRPEPAEAPLFPYAAGTFGSGANMAFRLSVLQEMNGFDPALGAGSFAMGGDDLAAFFEVITRGYTLVYQPAAFLRHWHRRDYPGLRRQAYGYGVGLTAYLTKILLDRPTRLFDFIRRAPRALAHLFRLRSPVSTVSRGDTPAQKNISYPSDLMRRERMGMLVGPFRYLWSRRQSRKQVISIGSPPRPIQPPAAVTQRVQREDEAPSP
jgi:GT2 family glycosyltransferase